MEANIKLIRRCTLTNNLDQDCQPCRCRPMWCIDCIGKWFAHRQDQNKPNEWMSSKALCPTCRSRFCILDVSFIDIIH
jgi:E3 ubiquitin-protein ligase TM129